MGFELRERDLLLEIGHVALARGLFDESLQIMDGLVRLCPDAPHPRIGRALTLFVMGQESLALDVLHETIALFPRAIFARSLLAKFMKQLGLPDAASVAREVLAMDPPAFVADIAREVIREGTGEAEKGDESGGHAHEARQYADGKGFAYPVGYRGTFV